MEIPRELAKAIKENNLVLFVGARLSHDFVNTNGKELGDWKNLVKVILANVDGLDYLEPILNRHDPLDILGLIEKTNKKSEVIEFVQKFFLLPDDKKKYSFHKKLCDLSNKIITTNYDNAFEIANPVFKIQTASWGKDFGFRYLLNPFDEALFKLHGCIIDGGRIILFPSDYSNLYGEENEDAERIIFHLRNLIVNKTILFIGYGMGDIEIKNIFSDQYRILGKFYKKKHYIITRKKELDTTLNEFLIPIPIDDSPKKTLIKNIEPIIDELLKIKEENDEDRVKLKKQLKQLEEIQEKRKNESDRIKHLSLKYTIKGIELGLKDDFEKSIEKFEVSTELDPCNAVAFYNWGVALYHLAKIKDNDENLLNQAFEKYDMATQNNPEYASAFYNWDTENAADAFNNWGNALYDLAEIKDNDENLLNQAIEKYDMATQKNPEYADAFNNWGNALSVLAEIKDNDENLFNQAFEKYDIATQKNPEHADAFYGWGSELYMLGKMKHNKNLIKQGVEKCEKAYKINPDRPYNLACGYALLGEKEKALHYLEESLKNKTIEIDWVLNDDDWKNYHSDDDFINLINKYK